MNNETNELTDLEPANEVLGGVGTESSYASALVIDLTNPNVVYVGSKHPASPMAELLRKTLQN